MGLIIHCNEELYIYIRVCLCEAVMYVRIFRRFSSNKIICLRKLRTVTKLGNFEEEMNLRACEAIIFLKSWVRMNLIV